MGRLATEGMLEVTDFDTALRWHLQCNHYPAIPSYMVEPCKEAIEAIQDGDSNRVIKLPYPIYRGMDTCPAYALAEEAHLYEFL